jgi:hypothetical protein
LRQLLKHWQRHSGQFFEKKEGMTEWQDGNAETVSSLILLGKSILFEDGEQPLDRRFGKLCGAAQPCEPHRMSSLFHYEQKLKRPLNRAVRAALPA